MFNFLNHELKSFRRLSTLADSAMQNPRNRVKQSQQPTEFSGHFAKVADLKSDTLSNLQGFTFGK
jgi:hypothetical protein